MLYYLFYPLSDSISGFNIFQYISFRATLAAITALLISFFIGPRIIQKLQAMQVGEEIRQEGPESHKQKAGTPTMGGIIVLSAVIVPTILWAKVLNTFILVILLATLWMGVFGFLDDYLKVIKKLPKGLIGRYKIAGQVSLGLVVSVIVLNTQDFEGFATLSTVPFFKNYEIDFGILYIPLVVFIIVAASNSVNLTDGLDGLAIGLVAIAAIAFAAITYVTGRVDVSE